MKRYEVVVENDAGEEKIVHIHVPSNYSSLEARERIEEVLLKQYGGIMWTSIAEAPYPAMSTPSPLEGLDGFAQDAIANGMDAVELLQDMIEAVRELGFEEKLVNQMERGLY